MNTYAKEKVESCNRIQFGFSTNSRNQWNRFLYAVPFRKISNFRDYVVWLMWKDQIKAVLQHFLSWSVSMSSKNIISKEECFILCCLKFFRIYVELKRHKWIQSRIEIIPSPVGYLLDLLFPWIPKTCLKLQASKDVVFHSQKCLAET